MKNYLSLLLLFLCFTAFGQDDYEMDCKKIQYYDSIIFKLDNKLISKEEKKEKIVKNEERNTNNKDGDTLDLKVLTYKGYNIRSIIKDDLFPL